MAIQYYVRGTIAPGQYSYGSDKRYGYYAGACGSITESYNNTPTGTVDAWFYVTPSKIFELNNHANTGLPRNMQVKIDGNVWNLSVSEQWGDFNMYAYSTQVESLGNFFMNNQGRTMTYEIGFYEGSNSGYTATIWPNLENNQFVTNNALLDAVNAGLFTSKTTIPNNNQWVNSATIKTLINLNTSYLPSPSNKWVRKDQVVKSGNYLYLNKLYSDRISGTVTYKHGLLGWSGMPEPNAQYPFIVDADNQVYGKVYNPTDGSVYKLIAIKSWSASQYTWLYAENYREQVSGLNSISLGSSVYGRGYNGGRIDLSIGGNYIHKFDMAIWGYLWGDGNYSTYPTSIYIPNSEWGVPCVEIGPVCHTNSNRRAVSIPLCGYGQNNGTLVGTGSLGRYQASNGWGLNPSMELFQGDSQSSYHCMEDLSYNSYYFPVRLMLSTQYGNS